MKASLRAILCLLLLGLWFSAAPLRAAVVDGLYEARVPLANQSASQRAAALQQAFAAVLVKVSGSRAAATLVGTFGSPSQYVQQYRYEKVPTDPASPSLSPQSPSLVLWAKFDRSVVENALHSAHAPEWGAERPRTLVWLSLPDAPGGRILAAADASSPLMQSLLTAADQRGVPLVFPQMDGPDQAAIGAPDITGFNLDRIHRASQRYKPDAVLVGSITPLSAGQFAAHWELIYPDRAESWDTPAGDEIIVAVDGVQTSADRYAARYAIAPGAGDLASVPLEVDNVTSLDAYAKVSSYLASLTPVRAVHVQRVAKGSAYFTLDIHGSLDNLESALVLGGSMAAVAAPPPGTVAPSAATAPAAVLPAAPLRYSYNPGP